MALNILPGTNLDNGIKQNTEDITLPSSVIPIELSINTESPWIYCNYPEHITDEEMLADENNARLIRQEVPAGNVQVFYSHFNEIKEDNDKKEEDKEYINIRYGIRIYNPNNFDVTITPTNCGHSDGTWADTSGGVWQRFFKGVGDCVIKTATKVSPYKSLWIMDKLITPGVFSGNLRFTTTASVAVSVYAYKNRSNVGDSTKTYLYDEKSVQYTGIGEGFFFSVNKITLNASELFEGKYFSTQRKQYSPKSLVKVNGEAKSDLIPIHIAGSNQIAGPGEDRPLHNVGNWCAQYYIPIRLYNDTNSKVTFKAYVHTGAEKSQNGEIPGSTFIISSGSSTQFGAVGGENPKAWNWLKCEVEPYEAIDDAYQYIFGTNSSAHVNHVFIAEKSK